MQTLRCKKCWCRLEPPVAADLRAIKCPHCDTPQGYAHVVGDFTLQALLGEGGFSSVWKAEHRETGQVVALKLFPKDEEFHLHRQVNSGLRLRHPNIVSVFAADKDEETSYLVTEYVPGESLRRRMQRELPSTVESGRICAALADAVHYAHQQGIVHRDLKPSNVLLDSAGCPRVIDFGLSQCRLDVADVRTERLQVARALMQARRNGKPTMRVQVGTPGYSAPEQRAELAAEANRRNDIYSLGVILYELLVGDLPPIGPWAWIKQTLASGRDERRDPIWNDLKRVSRVASSPAPEDRYATAACFATDIRCALRGQSMEALRTSHPK